uniref:MMPL family transporter n=1 Tax=Schlesneria paludicola TaxID=360056 RepID=A0A7C2JZK1_9PLAN
MFDRWGQFVVRFWPVVLAIWIVGLYAVAKRAPALSDVVQTGEFKFLPPNSPSLVAERNFKQAFPEEASGSTLAVVVRRNGAGKQLTDEDLAFVDDELDDQNPDSKYELRERLLQLAPPKPAPSETENGDENLSVITFRNKNAGRFLLSPDRQATLVLMELQYEFMDAKNKDVIDAVETLLFHDEDFRSHMPEGLELALSGAAVVGRDMMRAARQSAQATEHLTIILVIVLLILIYRAPLLWLVPLSTVFVAVMMTMKLLCIGSQYNLVVLFSGIESYVTVLLYGAGVDYCLFLIARYKEELDQGVSPQQAVIDSVSRVGAAIAASAGTVICGIGMMAFAEFGKFHEAGIAISFGLAIVLLAALSFTPALLGLSGRWMFWQPPWKKLRLSWIGEGGEHGWLQSIWDHVGGLILKRPMFVWLASIAAMLPFAVVGVIYYTHLSYGLLSDLPKTTRSVVGTEIVKEHFPAGTTGGITVLVHSAALDFTQSDGDAAGIEAIRKFTAALRERLNALQLSDIRSVSHPFGGDEDLASIGNPIKRRTTTARSIARYVSHAAGFADHWTRVEITANIDPFSRDSIDHLSRLEREVRDLLPQGTDVFVYGTTASIRDLKDVTDRDQVRIDLLVIAGVFVILWALLRQPGVCLYLIVSVLFSYLAALGVTYLAFWWYDGADFAGLDWKVPMFLFTILIAVGEDYNIFLMSRIEEERLNHGPVNGVVHALSKTGRIISSCGIIMAGTFSSLAAGSLKGMSQLGFALAFGVLLDTFVVRPILVPAYLVLLHSGRFGPLGKLLGAKPVTSKPSP